MNKRKIVLADANIFIDLDKFRLFDFVSHVSTFFNWDVRITEEVEKECSNVFTRSRIKQMIEKGTISRIDVKDREIFKIYGELSLYMESGAEVELFAIARCFNYNIITHDLKCATVYFRNFFDSKFKVYDLYRLFYLAYKARLVSLTDAQNALGSLKESSYLMPNGFQAYSSAMDKYVDKIFDPDDIAILRAQGLL